MTSLSFVKEGFGIKLQDSLNKFPDFVRKDTFIDTTHKKL